MIPLVVFSETTGFISDLRRRAALPLEVVELTTLFDPAELARRLGPRVVFMRTGTEGELHTAACHRAVQIENAFRESGARIVNPPSRSMAAHRKDQWYRELRVTGISVPACISNPTVHEILAAIASGELSFPFVYRLADAAAGQGLHLVTDPEHLVAVHGRFSRGHSFHRRIRAWAGPYLSRVPFFEAAVTWMKPYYETSYAPFFRTVATQYVEDRIGEYFAKVRLVVMGPKIDMQARLLSRHWISNLSTHATAPKGMLEMQRSLNDGYSAPARLKADALKVGQIMGFECYAIDALTPADQTPVIVDINPLYFFMESEDDRDPAHYRGHFERLAAYLHSLPV